MDTHHRPAWTPITKDSPRAHNHRFHKGQGNIASRVIEGNTPIAQDGTHREKITMHLHPNRTPTQRHRTGGASHIQSPHSDNSSSARLDQDDQPGPSGTSGQSVPLPQSQPTTEPSPSGNTTTAPTQWAHITVPRTRQSAVCPPLQGSQANPLIQANQGPGVSGSRHTVQGTEAQDNREAGRTAVRQGEDRAKEPTLHKALSNIMGAFHHSQETMGTVLAKIQEAQRLQERQYLDIRDDLKSINTTLVTIAGVLADMANTMRETVAYHWAQTMNSLPRPPGLVDRRSRHRTNRPPAPRPLQKESHPAIGPCDPGRRQRTLPRPRQEIRLS
ncbi:hypothetical protein NDU88_006182 [Pleurodeles waltl]|uniref:Uncharacterized protein n=1 Tax=Pleurodeles waltl TaxID=8319 RepID=A0AAV7UP92_PLEWA|nr:hypothetical protein NDU88_006182 [Pleurodeles waltl]